MATPLKVKDASGNIQQLTTTEENYIAYQVGLHLSTSDSAEVGSLNRATTGDTVGTFSNTFFNQAVGTHPSTSITTGTTNTVIYQTTGTAAETDANVFKPLMWVDSGGQTGFKMMPDADLNSAVDRYLTKIFTNEYPGSYRLSTSAPSGDWTEQQTAFIDTRTDGASIAHKLWKRTGGTAPTAVQPMRLKNEASFAGIQEMSDAEIKFSFGQRAKTRIAASKIGSYQLRNSSQGAPTDAGTWVAKGTATDTKNTTADANFTRDSTVNFSESYTISYTTDYATNYTSITDVPYISVSTAQFSVDYSRDFGGTFAANYTGSYEGAYVTTYERNFAANYVSNYVSTTDVGYVTQYTRNFTGNFTNNFVGGYTRNFTGNFATTYQRDFSGGYTRNFTGNFTGAGPTVQYERGFESGYEALRHDYYSGPGGNYQRIVQFGMPFKTYLRDYATNYVRATLVDGPAYSGNAPVANYAAGGQYVGTSTQWAQNYLGPGISAYYQGSGRQGIAYTKSGSDFPDQTYVDERSGNYISGGAESFYESPQVPGPDQGFIGYYLVEYQAYRQATYDFYSRNFLGQFTGAGPTVAYTRNTDVTYTRNFVGGYTTDYTRNTDVTYNRDFTGNFENTFSNQFGATYTTTYTGDYQNEFANSYVNNFSESYSRNFEGPAYENNYESIYEGAYTTQYTLDYEGNYVTTYEGNYETEYSRDFDTAYITDYLGNFEGNFAGETIQSGNATNETYTLYVRIS